MLMLRHNAGGGRETTLSVGVALSIIDACSIKNYFSIRGVVLVLYFGNSHQIGFTFDS